MRESPSAVDEHDHARMIFAIDVEQIENGSIDFDGISDGIDVGLADGIAEERSDFRGALGACDRRERE